MPDDMGVTAAARVLGVGRPALSKLLNEHASLTPEMALGIEKAFNVKMDTLLRMQPRHDAHAMRQRADEIQVSRFEAAAQLCRPANC